MLELNLKFSGDYQLLKWILKKYQKELPYAGQMKEFTISNNYDRKVIGHWSTYGINYRVWNGLHKDLLIASLMGRIEYQGLDQLKKEYKEFKTNFQTLSNPRYNDNS